MTDTAPRDTKTITTPSGVEVVLNAYLLGGDILALERAPLAGASLKTDGKTGGVEMPADAMYKARHDSLVDRVIVSIGGKEGAEKGPALEALRAPDYRFVMDAVAEIAAEALPAEKKS